ncbi:MAG: DUF3455 domain-containing protein [Candidatus Acidiferrum sp.]
MSKSYLGFGIASLLAMGSMFISIAAEGQQVPEQLRPPANAEMVARVHAKGDQIYTCKEDIKGYGWTLKAPDAQLFDKDGKSFGRHFDGPTWEAKDGSRVMGKAAANVSPDPDSVPWLLVKVMKHKGNGVLSRVTTIQRIETKGGKAPASGCDEPHAGQEIRVAYTADYVFWAAK